jgi:hypothetical protein
LLLILAPALLAGGCVNEPIGQRDPGLGEAVRYNAAVQTINPDPVYAEGGAMPGDHGEHAARAVQRYREGEVKEVQMMETTSGTSGPE